MKTNVLYISTFHVMSAYFSNTTVVGIAVYAVLVRNTIAAEVMAFNGDTTSVSLSNLSFDDYCIIMECKKIR